MGCDIHAVIEYKNGDGWQALKVANRLFGKYDDEPAETASLDINRNYDLFAILGNVRHGYGVAGINTGDGFVPMSDGRGFPDDMSVDANAAVSHEHSATWVTLPEILSYDWTRSTKKRGVVSAREFEKWDRYKGEPDSYCGEIAGPNIQHVTPEKMHALVKAAIGNKVRADEITEALELLKNTYCTIEWETTYANAARQLWTAVLPHMLKLGSQYGHDNVRLVMDFDS
jgi:hypothetical protein